MATKKTATAKPESLCVVLTTIGRPTLTRCLQAYAHQLQEQDVMTILVDGTPEANKAKGENWTERARVQIDACLKLFKCEVDLRYEQENLGFWGHGLRNKHQDSLKGDWLWHVDDDDLPNTGAVDTIHEHFEDSCEITFYKVKTSGFISGGFDIETPWEVGEPLFSASPFLRPCNIGTMHGVVENDPALFGIWGNFHGGDFLFWAHCAQKVKKYKHVDSIIQLYRHE